MLPEAWIQKPLWDEVLYVQTLADISVVRCMENVQRNRWNAINTVTTLETYHTVCKGGSTVQASNYTSCSHVYTVQPLLRSHENLLTDTASRLNHAVWQSANKISRRIAQRSVITLERFRTAWLTDARAACVRERSSTTWSSVQRSLSAVLERS